ncbi:peptidoglycan DD-metalloendopeptidase family protein [Streptomyces sp. NPDC020983]|uniref:peptidoglycan DD-metalloendopeptidase family protein n=1 Tax=Streptomyces sp. NPDC020983 TaxID=3365106 RepID=UPI00379C2E35
MAFTAVWLTMVTALLAAAGGAPGGAGGPGAAAPARQGAGRSWPVAGQGPRGRPVVLRAFEAPATPWGPGHRGADLRAGPGAAVRAAAPGEVVFTGQVAGRGVLVLRIGPDLRITYEPVRAAVAVGAEVAAGQRVGVLEGALAHCPEACLHWGLLRSGPGGDVYLDPLSLLPRSIRRGGPSRLLPVFGVSR